MTTPDPTLPTVLVLGASGFLGRAISRELHRRGSFNLVLAHRRAAGPSPLDRTNCVQVDLGDKNTLTKAAKGVDWIVHVANYIGTDAAEMERTNVFGTEQVVQAALEADAELLYISTASVYGHGPFRGEEEEILRVGPISLLSHSRAEAERRILAAGGTVLRPNLTYGCGDKWFIPTLVTMMKRLTATVDAGSGLVSVISVELLAWIVAELVSGNGRAIRGMAVNASQPEPVAIRTIVAALERELEFQIPPGNLSLAAALERAGDIGLSPHQVRLLGEDNWFSSAKLWTALSSEPAPAFALTADSRRWYLDYFRKVLHGGEKL
ncbi:NAD-dependent epimerase/dehydratase family protein [Arthrobacter sp. S13_S34]|nr:NAD-dependent epimerase/dehydratase family protein [Arthrobacter sp. S13_S34]